MSAIIDFIDSIEPNQSLDDSLFKKAEGFNIMTELFDEQGKETEEMTKYFRNQVKQADKMIRFLESHLRRAAVKNRRIVNQEKCIRQLELEVESLLVEKQRMNLPVTPSKNRAWFLD